MLSWVPNVYGGGSQPSRENPPGERPPFFCRERFPKFDRPPFWLSLISQERKITDFRVSSLRSPLLFPSFLSKCDVLWRRRSPAWGLCLLPSDPLAMLVGTLCTRPGPAPHTPPPTRPARRMELGFSIGGVGVRSLREMELFQEEIG